jgi:hypothetical protein
MGKFSPTKQHGDCAEIANPSIAYGRRRRNWIDGNGAVPAGQVVDASCGDCITLKYSYLRPRVEQPGKYRKIADRVHRLRVGQHFGRSGRRHRRAEPQPIPLGVVRGCAAGQGVGARAAGRERARHEGRGVVERASMRRLGSRTACPRRQLRKSVRKQFRKNQLGGLNAKSP